MNPEESNSDLTCDMMDASIAGSNILIPAVAPRNIGTVSRSTLSGKEFLAKEIKSRTTGRPLSG
jgi:hypothetical protein